MTPHEVFFVCDEPYCVWGWDLAENNTQFINEIDEKYFEYICQTQLPNLSGANSQLAALSIRANYHLALETLFSLIGALIQSASFVPGWILKASTAQIREIVRRLRKGDMRYPAKLNPAPEAFDFDAVVKLIFQSSGWTAEASEDVSGKFVALFNLLASDFLDEAGNKEYNSIKHGFRARSGGFQLAMGVQKERGKPAEREDMKSLGGSEFGSSFFVAERIDKTQQRGSPHFKLMRQSINWLPEATVDKTMLVALMIKNVKASLTLLDNPEEPTEFARPIDLNDIRLPWSFSIGVTNITAGISVSESDVHRWSREQLREKFDQSFTAGR